MSLESFNPRSGEAVGRVETTPLVEIPQVVERSRKAFAAWSALSHDERRLRLVDFKRLILARGEEIAALVTSETGKPEEDAYAYDVILSLATLDHYRGARFASRLRSGTVAINDVAVNFITPNLAFGGIGDSGFGSTFGAEGIRTFCYPKSITAARLRWPTSQLLGGWFPRRRPHLYWKTLARALFRW